MFLAVTSPNNDDSMWKRYKLE